HVEEMALPPAVAEVASEAAPRGRSRPETGKTEYRGAISRALGVDGLRRQHTGGTTKKALRNRRRAFLRTRCRVRSRLRGILFCVFYVPSSRTSEPDETRTTFSWTPSSSGPSSSPCSSSLSSLLLRLLR